MADDFIAELIRAANEADRLPYEVDPLFDRSIDILDIRPHVLERPQYLGTEQGIMIENMQLE